ncbi:MAG TPA: response regulator transcription factor [Acidimicrobiales bacterium]|nr:response regulator transcription factor [Acidimicrobiales bacterium]
MTVRVLVADDHTMVREGLSRALEQAGFEVVGQAGDGEEAVAGAVALQPDVVLMDLSMPVLSGVAATRQIRRQVPGAAVLILTMLSDEAAVSSALAAGASGYLVKDCTTAELVEAVRKVADGEPVLSPAVAGVAAGGAGSGDAGTDSNGGKRVATGGGRRGPRGAQGHPQPLLSKREEEVLRMMSKGVTITEAADRLYISVKTVKNHLSSIYEKLDCHDRAQAVLRAVRMGLIQLD